MPYELPSWLWAAGTLVLIVGVVAGLALGVAVAAGGLAQRRWPTLLVGIAAAVAAAYLIAVAASRDAYFGDATTRWDYAARNGSRPLVYAAVALALLTVVTLAASRRSSPWRSVGLILGGLACGLVFVAVIAISIGH